MTNCISHSEEFTAAFNLINGRIEQYHMLLGYPLRFNDGATVSPFDDAVLGPFNVKRRMTQHRDICLALLAEVTEILDTAPWKPWRPDDYKGVDVEHMAEEVVDAYFFLASLCENWNITNKMLGEALEAKLRVCYDRIYHDYNKSRDEIEQEHYAVNGVAPWADPADKHEDVNPISLGK